MIAEPLLAGAVQDTSSRVLPFATSITGASGTVAFGAPVIVLDQGPAPPELTARTRRV